MWIKEFNGTFSDSWIDKVNFLFKQDKIYIMDNHLCAAWCWMDNIEQIENNNLIHIDRHYDLLNHPSTIKQIILEPKIDLKKLTFSEYENLYIESKRGISKVFRWDNYILNLKEVYNNYYGTTIFSTFDFANPNPDFIKHEISFIDFLDNIDDYINEFPHQNWILNIDIDYFFNTLNGIRIKVFSDEFIEAFANKIASIIDNLSVITFCLSPECCGGWENSIKVMKIFCEILKINFNLEVK
jgi:hypothetical protein